MRILGVDPGTVRMGYGVIEGDPPILVECGVLQAPRRAPLQERLLALYQGLEAVLLRLSPQEMAVEAPFPFKEMDPRSALAVGQAQGVAMLLAAQHHLPLRCFSPAQVKQRVAGYGAGEKEQVGRMVGWLLGLDSPPQPHDASDALAVALCHLYQSRLPAALRQG